MSADPSATLGILEELIRSFCLCYIECASDLRVDLILVERDLIVNVYVHGDDIGRVKGRDKSRLEAFEKVLGEAVRRHNMHLRGIKVMYPSQAPEKGGYAKLVPVVENRTPVCKPGAPSGRHVRFIRNEPEQRDAGSPDPHRPRAA